jgi:hypothetical protein
MFDEIWGATAKRNGELWSYQDVVRLPINRVWTVYENGSIDDEGYSDNNWYATPGIIPAYALGYLVTKVPWNETTSGAVWYVDSDEIAREERRALVTAY